MQSKYAALLVLSLLATFPALASAHGGEAKTKHEMNSADKSPREHGAGHAAALGKPADARHATRKVAVAMDDDMRFQPKRIDIKQGETIRFVVRNAGKVKHEMVLGSVAELKKHAALMVQFPEMEHEDPNAVAVEPGQVGEFAWTFTKPGSFDFACLVPGHFEAGMKGRIQVRK